MTAAIMYFDFTAFFNGHCIGYHKHFIQSSLKHPGGSFLPCKLFNCTIMGREREREGAKAIKIFH